MAHQQTVILKVFLFNRIVVSCFLFFTIIFYEYKTMTQPWFYNH